MVQDKGKIVKKTSSAQNVKRWGEHPPQSHVARTVCGHVAFEQLQDVSRQVL